jgi:hypothetical protein
VKPDTRTQLFSADGWCAAFEETGPWPESQHCSETTEQGMRSHRQLCCALPLPGCPGSSRARSWQEQGGSTQIQDARGAGSSVFASVTTVIGDSAVTSSEPSADSFGQTHCTPVHPTSRAATVSSGSRSRTTARASRGPLLSRTVAGQAAAATVPTATPTLPSP